jgi:hypothetical protein
LTSPAPNLFNGWVKRPNMNRIVAKRIVPFLALIFAGLLLTGFSYAAPAGKARGDEQVVEVKTLLSRDAVRPGETFKVAIILKVQPGYHINDNAPLDEFLVPTALAFDDNPGLEVVEIYYPSGHRGRFAYSQAELMVYEGEAVLGALLKTKTGIPAGPLKLKATLSYQACDTTSCMPPKDLPFEAAVSIVQAGRQGHDLHPEIFDKIPFRTLKK